MWAEAQALVMPLRMPRGVLHKSLGVQLILVWTCLISHVSCTCQAISGDSFYYDYTMEKTVSHLDSVEFSLCCNRTTLEVSWVVELTGNAFKYVTSLEYLCSGNQKVQLSGKSSSESMTYFAAINGSDDCTASLIYEDFEEEDNTHNLTLTCSVLKDLCLTNPCQPNEICYSKDDDFTCTCRKNFNNNCTACENGYQLSKNRSVCSCQDGEVRLVNASSAQEGLIELCMNNQYNGIADSSWGVAEAGVVCRQLGFNHDSEPLYYSVETNSSVVLSRVHCSGNESSLINCIWNGTNSSDINYSGRVGVKCDVYRSTQAEINLDTTGPQTCQDGEVRLVNGSSAQEGLIELCMNNQYNGIADSSWGVAEAGVVCRQLGFSHDSEPLYYSMETNATVFLSRVHCSGNESSLINCIWNGTNSSDINYSRKVGVKCDVYRSTQAEISLDTTGPLKTSSVKSMKLVEASCGALAVLLLVGLIVIIFILLFHKRCCSHRDHKVEVQKCFEQELDVGFAPVDFKFDIPASTSLHSVTTVVCPMEKEDFTKIELETQLSPVVERYTIPNVIQIP